LLDGRVGEPFSEDDMSNMVKKAQERAEKSIPPGYMDFHSKPPEQAAGDYLLWEQILGEAERRRCDVLLVTGDVKEDWWISGDGKMPAHPRNELVIELRNRGGGALFMLTPSQLLSRAEEIFDLRVDKRSVSDLAASETSRQEIYDHAFRAYHQHFDDFPNSRQFGLILQDRYGISSPNGGPLSESTLRPHLRELRRRLELDGQDAF
jgi:hypothetical protein